MAGVRFDASVAGMSRRAATLLILFVATGLLFSLLVPYAHGLEVNSCRGHGAEPCHPQEPEQEEGESCSLCDLGLQGSLEAPSAPPAGPAGLHPELRRPAPVDVPAERFPAVYRSRAPPQPLS